MRGTVLEIVDCICNGKVIKSYEFGYGRTIAPTSPPDLIKAAKDQLTRDGLVTPPFDFAGIDFKIRDG
jgi:hypothetical protein